jgi:hypothetical protein
MVKFFILFSIMWVIISENLPATEQTTKFNVNDTVTAANSSNDLSETIKVVWFSVSVILLVIGVIGNSLVLLTMSRQQLNGTSTSVYLMTMAVLDTLVLIVGLIPDWLEGSSIVVLKVSSALQECLIFKRWRQKKLP